MWGSAGSQAVSQVGTALSALPSLSIAAETATGSPHPFSHPSKHHFTQDNRSAVHCVSLCCSQTSLCDYSFMSSCQDSGWCNLQLLKGKGIYWGLLQHKANRLRVQWIIKSSFCFKRRIRMVWNNCTQLHYVPGDEVAIKMYSLSLFVLPTDKKSALMFEYLNEWGEKKNVNIF